MFGLFFCFIVVDGYHATNVPSKSGILRFRNFPARRHLTVFGETKQTRDWCLFVFGW